MTQFPRIFPFVVGSPRSGTTLLRAMLDSHPAVAVPGESYFIPYLWRRRSGYRSGRDFEVEPFLRDLFAHPWFARWALAPDYVRGEILKSGPNSYQEAVRAVFNAYALSRGKSRYADKTPAYVLHIPLLGQLFPEARFVHVIRDGREVALSVRDGPIGPDSIGEAALFWERRVKRARAAGRILGPQRYRELRYAALVADPEGTLQEVCDFISLTYDTAMLQYPQRAHELISSMSISRPELHRHLAHPPQEGLRNWKRDLSTDDIGLVEALVGDLLVELGFDRAVDRPSRRARLEAARVRALTSSRVLISAIAERVQRR